MAELWTPDCTANVTMIADPTLPAPHRGPSNLLDPNVNPVPPAVYLSSPQYLYGQPGLSNVVRIAFSSLARNELSLNLFLVASRAHILTCSHNISLSILRTGRISTNQRRFNRWKTHF